MLSRKRGEKVTVVLRSCVWLTPELKQMKTEDEFSLLWEIQARQNIESCINQINATLLHVRSLSSEKQQVAS